MSVSKFISDNPKITEHRMFDISRNANMYRWDCGNKSHADTFYINPKCNEADWLQDKRVFVKNLFASEGENA